jgi:hypothetical protein
MEHVHGPGLGNRLGHPGRGYRSWSARVASAGTVDLGKGRHGRNDVGMAKSQCPLSQAQFLAKAEPLKIGINGQEMLAEVKAFSTGSFGWYLNGKTTVMVDGKAVSIQIGMNLTIVGSKEAPRDA